MNSQEEETTTSTRDKLEKDDAGNALNGRKTWANNIEYILSLFGYTTGMADVWRFPYLVWRNGGGAFVIAFICSGIICGIPLYFMELVVSQYSGKSIYGIWDMCHLFKGVGISMGILNIVFMGYASMIRYWLIEYMVTSFTGLPWLSCNNTWNTNSCITSDTMVQINDSRFDGKITYDQSMNIEERNTLVSSEEEFWQYKVLDLSKGIDDIGNIRWNFCIYALVYRIVVTIVVIKSVKSIGKAMYVFTIFPLLVIIAMWIRALCLPGAIDGIAFFLIPDFSQLASIRVWIEAVMMAFYSLGPVWGGLFLVGSHSKYKNNCTRAAIIGCSADGIMSIFSSVVLFSVFGVAAKGSGTELEHTVKAGMSVGLVGYTKALSYLPLPQVWTILFFVSIVVTTMDTQVVTQEMIISFFQEIFPNKFRNRRMVLIIGTSVLVFILNLPFCTQGGAYMVQILDWYHATLPILTFAVVECVTFMWIYGGEKIDTVLRMMIKRSIPHLIRVSVAFVMPCILAGVLIISLVKYKPPTYGSYIYPSYVEIVGWIIVTATVLPVPLYIVHRYMKDRVSFQERVKNMVKPCDVWVLEAKEKPNTCTKRMFIDRIKFNLTGTRNVEPCELELNCLEDVKS